MTSEDVHSLIECHSELLTNENLVEMTKSASIEENNEDLREEETEERVFTVKGLQDLCNVTKDLQRRAQDMDDDMFRAVHFSNLIDRAMTAYKMILAQTEKNTNNFSLPCFSPAQSRQQQNLRLWWT